MQALWNKLDRTAHDLTRADTGEVLVMVRKLAGVWQIRTAGGLDPRSSKTLGYSSKLKDAKSHAVQYALDIHGAWL